MTSSNRRSLVAGGVAVAAALTSVLLSACGAGQVAQTAQIQSAVPGANAQAPGRLVFVRNATVDYPGTKGYPQGAGAALTFWVFNNTQDPVSLVGVGAAEVTTDGRNMPVQVRQMTGANTASPCAVPRSPSMPPAPTNSASSAFPTLAMNGR